MLCQLVAEAVVAIAKAALHFVLPDESSLHSKISILSLFLFISVSSTVVILMYAGRKT